MCVCVCVCVCVFVCVCVWCVFVVCECGVCVVCLCVVCLCGVCVCVVCLCVCGVFVCVCGVCSVCVGGVCVVCVVWCVCMCVFVSSFTFGRPWFILVPDTSCPEHGPYSPSTQMPQTLSRRATSTSFLLHYILNFSSLETVYSEILTALLTKAKE